MTTDDIKTLKLIVPPSSLDEDAVDESYEPAGTDSLAATLAAATSGGVAGAALGHLVGGRVGATIGAVVGGVAGAAIGNDVSQTPGHAAGVVELGNDVSDHNKAFAADRADRIETLKQSTEPLQSAQDSLDAVVIPAETHYRLGVSLGRQGALESAIAEFQEALNLAPDSAETYYNLGIAFIKQGNLNQGLNHLRHAKLLCLKQSKVKGVQIVTEAIQTIAG